MQIKQAILQTEKQSVKNFLETFDLAFREDVEHVAYVEDENKDEIIGTVSLTGNLIMQLAVSKDYQGENIALLLIDYAIKTLREKNIYGYKVFTKPQYLPLFENMGFRKLVETESFVALEGGVSSIKKSIDALATKVAMELGGIEKNAGAIVINGNPFTNGHMQLVEYALQKHKRVLLFVLEEDASYFSFKERFSLAFVAMRPYYDKVSVLPSTEYIISKSTFPDYFIKDANSLTKAYAVYDALIFKNYFMPALGISKRYFGTENTNYMSIYNQTCKEVLGEQCEIVERFSINEQEISAKKVRVLIEEGNIEKALEFVPTSCKSLMKLILNSKQ